MKNNFLQKWLVLTAILLCGFSYGQTLKGKVSDSAGELPGVNIVVKGTTNGTTSKLDGTYVLSNVKSTDVVVFSYVGYRTMEIGVAGKSVLNVVLEEDANSLDEVVVVGYGTKKKSLVTGAISSIDGKQLKSSSNQRVEQVLQGRTSGVTVSSSSGAPGSGAKIRIRGAGSSGNSSPLYIVDGMKTSSIESIAPTDIANIEILKDAASAAIYGTEGANGVVIITTKKGKVGELKIGFNSQFGMQFVNTGMDLMNASQFVTYMNEAGQSGVTDNGYDTNWIKETFSPASMYRYDLNLSGASEKTSYYASIGHLKQDGIVGKENSSFERANVRLNLTSQVTKWLEVGVNATHSTSNKTGVPENNDTRGVIQNMLIIDPLTPVTYLSGNVPQSVYQRSSDNGVPVLRDANGNVYGYPSYSTGEVINPVAYANGISNSQMYATQNLVSAYLKFSIMEGLTFTSRFGYENGNWDTRNMTNPYYVSSEASNTSYTGSQTIYRSNKWLWENFASYTKSYKEHNFALLAGYSAENTRGRTLISRNGSASIADFTGFDFDLPDFNKQINNVIPNPDNMVSMFARLSYDFADKYLFEASIRQDTSDKFPTANKSGVFPSFSAGWVVSKEDNWKEDGQVDYLKVRASWGQNGSRSNLSGNSDKTFIVQNNSGFDFDYLGNLGAQITGYANPNLVWETSEQLDLGADARAFDNRLSVSVDYYKKTTRDAIVANGSLVTPGSAGFVSNEFNAGTIENSGFEFELGYRDVTASGLSYAINANFSTLKNTVKEILFVPEGTSLQGAGAPQNADGVTRFSQGLPSWYFYGYKTAGIDPATGEINKVDTNADGTVNSDDKTMIGSPHPDLLFGGNVSLGYKAFDFNLQFQGSIGNDIMSTYHQPSRPITNKPVHFFTERWKQAGDNASFPGAGNVISSYDTDLMVESGSFMRIKQIQFGYTLPSNIADKLKVANLRMYLSLDDILTFTNYKGLDPEVGNFGFNSIGVDRGFYPTAAKTLIGLSVDF